MLYFHFAGSGAEVKGNNINTFLTASGLVIIHCVLWAAVTLRTKIYSALWKNNNSQNNSTTNEECWECSSRISSFTLTWAVIYFKLQWNTSKEEQKWRVSQEPAELMLMAKTNANHDISNIIFVDTIESTLCKYIHRIYIWFILVRVYF